MTRNARNKNKKKNNKQVAVASKNQQQQAAKEVSAGRKILRAIGGMSGGALGLLSSGSLAGAHKGYTLGRGVGDNASTILGLGRYKVRKNSLMACTDVSAPVPFMHSGDQSTIVRHTEYLGDVTSSATANTFAISSAYPLNPGIIDSFPWLSTIANQYQEYNFRGVAFEFRSTSADAIASSTNTALGSVIMGTTYNPAAAVFTSKIQMLNEYFSVDCKPSENMIHYVECDPKENPFNILYVRAVSSTTPANIQNYDLGNFYIATAGFQGTNVVCGELWVTYEVELRKPAVVDITYPPINAYTFKIRGTSGTSTSNYFGAVTQFSTFSWGGSTATFTGTTVTLPPGYAGPITVIYIVYGSSVSLVRPGFTVSNSVNYNIYSNNTANIEDNSSTTGGTYLFTSSNSILNPALNTVITFSGGTLPTSATSDFFVFASSLM